MSVENKMRDVIELNGLEPIMVDWVQQMMTNMKQNALTDKVYQKNFGSSASVLNDKISKDIKSDGPLSRPRGSTGDSKTLLKNGSEKSSITTDSFKIKKIKGDADFRER
jgi:hypothetical protein